MKICPKAYERWFGRSSRILAVAALVVAVVHPAHGLGVPLCLFHKITGLPCPGCGMLRSLSCTARGMFSSAWQYNPFGPILLPVFAAIAVIGLLPRRRQRRFALSVARRAPAANVLYVLLVASFLTFGLGRAALCLAQRLAS